MAPRLDTAPTADTGKWVGTKIWQWVRAVGTAIAQRVSGLAKPGTNGNIANYPVWQGTIFDLSTVDEKEESAKQDQIVRMAEPLVKYTLTYLSSMYVFTDKTIPKDIELYIQSCVVDRLERYTEIMDILKKKRDMSEPEKEKLHKLIADMMNIYMKLRLHTHTENGKTVRTISRRPDPVDTDTVE